MKVDDGARWKWKGNSPIKTAPATSQNVANQQACRMVNTPEPTLVPKELATSFAPIPKARMNAMTKPMTTSQKASVRGSITVFVLRTSKIFQENIFLATFSWMNLMIK